MKVSSLLSSSLQAGGSSFRQSCSASRAGAHLAFAEEKNGIPGGYMGSGLWDGSHSLGEFFYIPSSCYQSNSSSLKDVDPNSAESIAVVEFDLYFTR